VLIKIILFCFTLLLPALLIADPIDNFGVNDTLYAKILKINSNSWSIVISITNDENITAFSIPLKVTSGSTKIIADSAIFKGGRAENFPYKGFRPDDSGVTLGLIANIGSRITIPPGSGKIVTLYFSSLNNTPIEFLDVDTTTTYPNNKLMVIADRIQGSENQDTISDGESDILKIYPHFVVIKPD
jgi:hypothetical protein